jgi:uncharacterized phosphosugar-binding protein
VIESEYAAQADGLVHRIVTTQMPAIRKAAAMVAESIAAGGVLQGFGTGHSRIVTLELAARAGGLAPVGMLAVKDLVMYGNENPAAILDPRYERETGLAQRIYALADPRPADTFLIVSNSGLNAAIVEMAELVRGRGHGLVAITSIAHTRSTTARHTSGPHLADLADVVIDNCAPTGDASIELTPGLRIGAVSSFTGVLVAQILTELTCRYLLHMGQDVPVFISGNLTTGDPHNQALEKRYRGRVRPIEP